MTNMLNVIIKKETCFNLIPQSLFDLKHQLAAV